MEHRKQWRIHPQAKKEFEELPSNGRQGLAELMVRVRRGEAVLPREQDNYGRGLYGLKYSEARNEFRCYYGRDGRHGQYLVAVEFVYKTTESIALDTARARLKAWKEVGEARRRAQREEGGGSQKRNAWTPIGRDR
jgi:phage-related protein